MAGKRDQPEPERSSGITLAGVVVVRRVIDVREEIMDIQTPNQTQQEFLYLPLQQQNGNPALYFAGAIGLFVLAVVGFIFSVYAHVNIVTQQMVTTLPILSGVRLIMQAKSLQTQPRQVVARPSGLEVTTAKKVDTYAWSDFSAALFNSNSMTNKKEVTFYNKQGAKVLKLDESLQYFDHLRSLIELSVPKQADTGTGVRLRKARANGIFLIVGGVAFLALSIACAGFSRDDQRKAELMRTSLVPGVGAITGRFLAPDGVAMRVEYAIKSTNGKVGSHNAQVDRETSVALAGAKTVPVLYAPSDPNATRLVDGEIPDKSQLDPGMMYIVVALVGGMSIFFIVAGVLSLKGRDVYLSKSTGKLAIKNFGDPSV